MAASLCKGFEKKWIVFFLVGTSIFMSTLDSSIVNVALPFMMQDLKSCMQTIQWVVLSYLLTVSSLLLSFGRLSDIKGRKLVYVAGFSIFTAGSFLCALAGSTAALIVSRVIQGCGAAMLMACSPALIVDVFPAKERGKALGMIGAVVAAGLTIGPVAGGIILEYLSWRFIFYINIPIGVAAAMGGLFVLSKEKTGCVGNEPMDLKGSLILIVFLSSLIVFLTQLTRWDIFSWPSLFLAGLSVSAGTGFIVNERKCDFPLFDLKLLSVRLFVYPVIASAVLFAALFVVIFMMPFYLTYPCGFSASKTGFIMIVPFLFLLVISPVSGMLYDRYGSRMLCMIGMGTVAASLAALTGLEAQSTLWSVVWRIALAGIGTALFISPNNTATMSSVPLQRRGIASGSVATARNIGMVMGVALAGLMFTTSFSKLTGGATLEMYQSSMAPFFMVGFQRAMGMGAVLGIFGMIVTWARGKEPGVHQNKSSYSVLDQPHVLNRLFHPRRETGSRSVCPDRQDMMIPMDGKIELGASFHLADPDAPVVLYFHGNGEIVSDYDEVGMLFNRTGLNLFAVDYRGYGDSTGHPTVTAMMKDCHIIADFVKVFLTRNKIKGPLCVMGRSLGSASAIELASVRPQDFKCLIVESGFAFASPLLETLGIDPHKIGFREEQGFENIDKIKRFPKPCLVIHAQFDHIIPFSDGIMLYNAAASDNKKLLEIKDANHNDIFSKGMAQYMVQVRKICCA